MLDKIVISKDRKSARVYFDTHSVGFHSDQDVMDLIWEIIFKPSLRLEEIAKEKEARILASLEDTVEIDLSMLKDVA